jgi:hypothetical protein
VPIPHFRAKEELNALLLELPGLTSALIGREPAAVQLLTGFLERGEQLLVRNRMPQAAALAASRAALEAARLEETGGRGRQRQYRCALHAIGPIGAALAEALAPLEQRIDSVRLPARQLLQLIAASGAVTANGAGDLADLIERIWQMANQHDQLKPLAMQLRIALGGPDILLLLADELDVADFSG